MEPDELLSEIGAHFILFVADQAPSTRFYSAVLGTEPILNEPGMTEFSLGGGAVLGLMPGDGIARLLGDSIRHPNKARGIPRSDVYLLVSDVKDYYARAIAAGARELSPLTLRDWGHRVAYCLDPDGHILAIATIESN